MKKLNVYADFDNSKKLLPLKFLLFSNMRLNFQAFCNFLLFSLFLLSFLNLNRLNTKCTDFKHGKV